MATIATARTIVVRARAPGASIASSDRGVATPARGVVRPNIVDAATRQHHQQSRSGGGSRRRARAVVVASSSSSSSSSSEDDAPTRREAVAAALAAIALATGGGAVAPSVARADSFAADIEADLPPPPPPRVLVVGATGQTGSLVVRELKKRGDDIAVVAAVRSEEKAAKMGVDGGNVSLLGGFDVTADASTLAAAMTGIDKVIVCTGFVPGNPFKMSAAAHSVDNEGVIHLVDAAKAAGVKRLVLVSSILTDGRAMGAEGSPGFKITNAFGGVLDEKLVGEKYLQGSGLEYVIVRPAGLRADPPKTPLVVTPGNVMASGEISRELVAAFMSAAAFSSSAKNKIYEIAEEGTFAPGYSPDGVEKFIVGDDRSKWFKQ